ncbi:MAG TPA: winged helix-turn-helix domain-containing protein [Nitrososphaerales archaeon]|nr:winged helix-turn-helix domain-containing protein [Nitrososphaerales archaeon]
MQVIESSLPWNAVAQKTIVTEANSEMGLVFLKAISDVPCNMIMRSAISKGKSVEEICSETGVPTSTAYRKVSELTESGLLFIERVVVSDEGKKRVVYRAAYSKVAVQCDIGNFVVESTPNTDVPDILYRLWQFARSRQEHSSG